jgi:hypothetical protein
MRNKKFVNSLIERQKWEVLLKKRKRLLDDNIKMHLRVTG